MACPFTAQSIMQQTWLQAKREHLCMTLHNLDYAIPKTLAVPIILNLCLPKPAMIAYKYFY